MYPERFSHLPEYAFPRFRALLDGHDFAGPQFNMTIGEPQHRYPAWIKDVLLEQIDGFNRYPANDGIEKLQVSKKGPRDFVTKTDKHVEKILIEELSKTKKNYSFL